MPTTADALADLTAKIETLVSSLADSKQHPGVCPSHDDTMGTLGEIKEHMKEGSDLFREISTKLATQGEQANSLRRDLNTHLDNHGTHRCETQSWTRTAVQLVVLIAIAVGSAWFGGKQAASAIARYEFKAKPIAVITPE